MGLDMYLNRMPRYKDVTATSIYAMDAFFDLEKEKAAKSQYANCTLKEWCGADDEALPDKETVEYFRPFYVKRYAHWDTAHQYGHESIFEQVGYWRKANQIHNWFVNNIQDGIDDCDYHREVTKEDLQELLEICREIYASCTLVDGKVAVGTRYSQNGAETIWEEGKVVADPSLAQELLPTREGFFFGGYSYNEYYVEDIAETIKIVSEVLLTTNFDKQMIYYRSSW